MFKNLNLLTLIEYLLVEIDKLTPMEKIYETYCEELYKISKLNFNLTYTTFRQKFIMKITSMRKSEIIEFCEKEGFVIEIKKIEEVLKRKIVREDYDL
tara:strand:- start:604 stop:897 length:294 start_codon:yes stop_codon:yes gene_type:complete